MNLDPFILVFFQEMLQKRNLIIALYLFLLSGTIGGLFGQTKNQFMFSSVNSNQGLSHNNPMSFLRDSKGFIWIGTSDGLNRYDGYSFKIFKNNPNDPNSIRNNSILSLYEAYDGRIWIDAGRYLEIYDPVTEKIRHADKIFNGQLKFVETSKWKLLKDRFNHYWFLSSLQGLFKYYPEKDSLLEVIHMETLPAHDNPVNICDIDEDSNGDIWLIDTWGKILKIKNNSLVIADSFFIQKTNNNFFNIFVDKDDDIWIYDVNNNIKDGVFFHSKTKEIQYFNSRSEKITLKSDYITGIEEDDQDNIWIISDHGGISIYNKANGTMQYLMSNLLNSRSISEDALRCIYKDYEGFIWIGTYKNGFCYYHKDMFKFNHYKVSIDGIESPRLNDIDNFAEDKAGNLWIGTNGAGLIYFNRDNNRYKLFQHNPKDPNSVSSDIIVGMLIDSHNNFWIGTYFGGLNKHENNIFTHFKSDSADKGTITDNRIWDICEDSEGYLWIATLRGGVDVMEPKTNKIVRVFQWDTDSSIRSNVFYSIIEDRKGRMWFATIDGIRMYNKINKQFTYYEYNPDNKNSISDNQVFDIYEDSRGLIWAATANGISIVDEPTGKIIRLNKKDGLPSNRILTILEDNNKNIWVSTSNGLSNIIVLYDGKKDTYSFKFINYSQLDGLQNNEFNEKSAFKTNKGELIFGGKNGFNIFRPEEIESEDIKPNIVFTDFLLFNKSYSEYHTPDNQQILNKSITYTDEIVLNYSENVITIEFSNLNYFHPERHTFQYKLENFNEDWVDAGSSERRATYTNLDPGAYIFKVRATDIKQPSNKDMTQLKIVITPPYWETLWFKITMLFILVLFIASVFYFIVNSLKKQKKRLEIAVSERTNELTELNTLLEERQEEIAFQNDELNYHRTKLENIVKQRTADLENALKKAEESDKLKSAFLANMSHEIRTPMNAIVGFSHLIREDELGKTERNEYINIIQKNCDSLLVIINDILDISKIEANLLIIKPTPVDIVRTFYEIENYYELKKIQYLTIKCVIPKNITKLVLVIDETRIRQIVQNLVDNSIKFTDEGSITFGFEYTSEYLQIFVEDTGIGIKPEDYYKVFLPFGKIDQNPGRTYTGTGLGLAICKKIVELMNGTISFKSEIGKGTIFKINLALDAIHKQDNQNLNTVEGIGNQNYSNEILVAEDEPANFALIEKILRKTLLNVTWAQNGKEAVNYISKNQDKYALILMDIKMPVMDGITAFISIREINSNIPVIAVTAYAYESEKVEILRNNFSGYITKPLKPVDLIESIEKILNRKIV
jgi:signal transduction histidine kinase/ligand-binding sensor domain-containing protein/CheY-like chemotaxis protein